MDHRWTELALTLRDLGMWKHLPEDMAASEQRAVADGGYPFVPLDVDMDARWFFVDGESMAEVGVERLLPVMAPALSAHGVELRVETLIQPRTDEEDYVVAINGRRCRVWAPHEWAGYRAWESATIRPLAVINDLLAEVGALPRLFTLYAGGNEGIAWLLDPRIVWAVARSGLVADQEVPALAADDG